MGKFLRLGWVNVGQAAGKKKTWQSGSLSRSIVASSHAPAYAISIYYVCTYAQVFLHIPTTPTTYLPAYMRTCTHELNMTINTCIFPKQRAAALRGPGPRKRRIHFYKIQHAGTLHLHESLLCRSNRQKSLKTSKTTILGSLVKDLNRIGSSTGNTNSCESLLRSFIRSFSCVSLSRPRHAFCHAGLLYQQEHQHANVDQPSLSSSCQ